MAGVLVKALAHSIRVVAVDDDQDVVELYTQACSLYPFYHVRTAMSAREGAHLLGGQPPCHVCICDLRLFDLNRDQLALVKRFASRTAFLIVSGSAEIKAAFEAGALHGACGLVVKGDNDSHGEGLLARINCCFLTWLFGVIPLGKVRPGLEDSATAFMQHFPSTVQEWAACRGVSQQALGKFYAAARGVEPRHILLLARAYCHAFAACGLLPAEVVPPPPLTPKTEAELCRELARQRQALNAVLRGGRWPAPMPRDTQPNPFCADTSLRNPLSDWA